MMKRIGLTCLAAAMVLSVAPRALAGGTEFPAAGTAALGRGGAVHARPGNVMSLLYNPANLAAESGLQLSLQTHVAFYDACFNRAGTYGNYGTPQSADLYRGGGGTDDTVDPLQRETVSAFNDGVTYPDGELPRVCNSGPPGIIPELVLTWRAHRMVGIGVGFVAPAGVGHTIWGNNTTIGDRRYEGTVDGLPSPARYGLIEEQLVIAFPTVGIGFAPHPRIRLGVAFGSGFGLFKFVSITRAVRGEDFANDIHTTLEATDAFIPRITASVHVVPHDNLDVSVTFTWTDDVEASGDVTLRSGYYRDAILDEVTVPNSTLSAPQPWQLAFGIRYADRIAPRPGNPRAVSRLSERVEDPMSNERFDIEFDLVYEHNSSVDKFVAELSDNPDRPDGIWFVEADSFVQAAIPKTLIIDHQWQNSLSLRLGGDWNVMPGLATVRLGLSYETKGVRHHYEQLDFLPFQRVGLHMGLTVRLGRFDISLAYAHIWQGSTNVTQGSIRQVNADHRTAEIACADAADCRDLDEDGQREWAAENSNFGEGTIVNAGRYTSNFDVVSLGLTYHFQ